MIQIKKKFSKLCFLTIFVFYAKLKVLSENSSHPNTHPYIDDVDLARQGRLSTTLSELLSIIKFLILDF